MQDMHLLLLSMEASVVKDALWEDSIVAITVLDSTHQPHLHTYITQCSDIHTDTSLCVHTLLHANTCTADSADTQEYTDRWAIFTQYQLNY